MLTRSDRQRAEIARLIRDGHLHRAADLGHEHLAEHPNDQRIRSAIVAALETSADRHMQRRALEFAFL